MFTHLHLTRFKAWADTGPMALRPVTLLLGTNSSGKSSLAQSLLLLKQTVQAPDRTTALNLGGSEPHDLFDFGEFAEVLHQPARGPRQFGVALGFRAPNAARVTSGRLACTYGQNARGGVVLHELTLATGARRFRTVRRGADSYAVLVDDERTARLRGPEHAPERSVALAAPTIAGLGVDGALADDISLAARRALEGIHYLGPFRRPPSRHTAWQHTSPGSLGSDGARVIEALLAQALSTTAGPGPLLDDIAHWLQRMGMAERLSLQPQGRTHRYALMVHRDGVASNLHDVGVGVAQVLPVLALGYLAAPGSTLILEEPELHLHPLAQAVLGDFFVTISQQRQVQFLVETHSEHLFRRLQTALAKNTVQRSDCALYFVERGETGASLRELSLDDYGRVLNWPTHFFGDALGETREQARLMLERQRRTAQP